MTTWNIFVDRILDVDIHNINNWFQHYDNSYILGDRRTYICNESLFTLIKTHPDTLWRRVDLCGLSRLFVQTKLDYTTERISKWKVAELRARKFAPNTGHVAFLKVSAQRYYSTIIDTGTGSIKHDKSQDVRNVILQYRNCWMFYIYFKAIRTYD